MPPCCPASTWSLAGVKRFYVERANTCLGGKKNGQNTCHLQNRSWHTLSKVAPWLESLTVSRYCILIFCVSFVRKLAKRWPIRKPNWYLYLQYLWLFLSVWGAGEMKAPPDRTRDIVMFLSECAAGINRKPDPDSAWRSLACACGENVPTHCFLMLPSSGGASSLLELWKWAGSGGERELGARDGDTVREGKEERANVGTKWEKQTYTPPKLYVHSPSFSL